MSGGSYDYLCWNTHELSNRRGMVEAMAKRLEKSGYREAARATRNVLYLLDGAQQAADALADVWHAVEWADSGDSDEDRVRQEIAKFVPWPPPADSDGN
jgi:hypothetical protein